MTEKHCSLGSFYYCFYIMEVRCRRCCKSLFKGDSILFNAHHEVKQQMTDVGCQANESNCSYMTLENAPDWIINAIDQVYSFHQNCRNIYTIVEI